MSDSVTKIKDGRGGFFAIDRRAWEQACTLGINASIAYLVLARGSGGDNRTTSWSTNAIETKTGISRGRAKAAIDAIVTAGLVRLTKSDKPHGHPAYWIIPAHNIPKVGGNEEPEWIWLPNAIID